MELQTDVSAAPVHGIVTMPFTPYYDCDGISIYHGDSRKIMPWIERCDLLLTDPPYGIGDRMQGGTWGAKEKYADFRAWDEAPKSYSIEHMVDVANISIIWGGNYYGLPASRCWLVWRKVNAVPTMAGAELAWTNMDKPCKAIDLPVGQHNHGHPTEKPIALMRWCLALVPECETVLDPFMGSGTTLVAARLEGRKAIGIEINEKYCEAAANRLAQRTLF